MSGDSQWMLPPEIFVYLSELFPDGGKILEFGSGDGTRILAENFDVCSIEHDEMWAEKIDTECHLIPIISNNISTKNNQEGWYDVHKVLNVIPDDLDIVIIDGPNGTIGRHGILSIVDSLPKNATYIVDDVHRNAEMDLYEKLVQWHGGEGTIFDSNYDSGELRQWGCIRFRMGD